MDIALLRALAEAHGPSGHEDRVRALVRRSQGARHLPATALLTFGHCSLNTETLEAETSQGRVTLSDKEARVMTLFLTRRGETLSRAEIHTASPRGVNSICNIALPGFSVFTSARVSVSITCTVS